MARFEVIKHGTLFYISDTLTLKSTGMGPFDAQANCQAKADEMNSAREEMIKRENEKTQARNEACRSVTTQDIYGGDRP